MNDTINFGDKEYEVVSKAYISTDNEVDEDYEYTVADIKRIAGIDVLCGGYGVYVYATIDIKDTSGEVFTAICGMGRSVHRNDTGKRVWCDTLDELIGDSMCIECISSGGLERLVDRRKLSLDKLT